MKYGYRTADSYPASADAFVESAQRHEGSWWTHWGSWIEARETRKVPARKPRTRGKYKGLEAAPGSYVKTV